MRLITSILLILLILSCNHQSNKNKFLHQISEYPKIIKDHFPKELKGMYRTAVMKDNEHDVISIMLLNQYRDSLYYQIKDSLMQIPHAIYKPMDSCLLVVNLYTNENNFFSSFKTNDTSYLNKNCLKNKLPIPNFWSLGYKSKNITKLPKDYHIIVFDASHNNIDKKYLSYNVYMPDYWNHGYSKGVAMNDKKHEVIYWFVLW